MLEWKFSQARGHFCHLSSLFRWRFGLVVVCWSRSTKLLYSGPG